MKFLLGICGFFLLSYLFSHPVVLEPSLTIDQVILKATHFFICIFFFFWLSAKDVASGRGSPIRLQPVPRVGSRLTGLAVGDLRNLLVSIKPGKGPPHTSKWGCVLIPLSLCEKGFSSTLLENSNELMCP